MRKIYISILLIFSSIILSAQTGAVRGFIYEEGTGEPAVFCNAILEGTTFGSTTDINGYFIITKIEPGSYTLKITYLGFDTITEKINIENDKIISKNYTLKKTLPDVHL